MAAGGFLVTETLALIRKVGDAQRLLLAFWKHPKSNNPHDPEVVLMMYTTLSKISVWFGVQPRKS